MEKIEKLDKKTFDFVFGCALVDAVLMKAYPHKPKPKVEDFKKKGLVSVLKSFCEDVLDGKYNTENGQDEFDKKFFDVAAQLKKVNDHFTFGNAQKLINMVFKHLYIIAYYDNHQKSNFKVCHCPMDSKMLEKAWKELKNPYPKNRTTRLQPYSQKNKKGTVLFLDAWSREDFNNDQAYKDSRYMLFQSVVREIASEKGYSPLEYDVVYW